MKENTCVQYLCITANAKNLLRFDICLCILMKRRKKQNSESMTCVFQKQPKNKTSL